MANGRYIRHNRIGEGSMGVVYLATDRLTQQPIALKKVQQTQYLFLTGLSKDSNFFHFALAKEFQILASLHHPNIISVLDYGFDQEKIPFYTMRYLQGAETILQAGAGRTISEKMKLIQQMLQALIYLHRHGVFHRDLKPKNVLVVDQQLKLVDFGLASLKGQNGTSGGTLLYMSPEILNGERKPYNETNDLYAVGVMAFELLAGHHPFDVTSADFAKQVIQEPPDLSQLGVDKPVANVIGRLLAKKREERYQKASDCLDTLNAALKQPAVENEAILESYLQAAAFVGREQELGQLTNALVKAQAGQGSAWLIGGESGVGKTRLIEELRIQALVEGMLVLKGQGISDSGGVIYQFFREPLRHLLLTTDRLDETTLNLFISLIPDLTQLFKHSPSTPVELVGLEARERLYRGIADLFQQQSQPILLILEDLQWAKESLTALNYLTAIVEKSPLLILGSFRDDERPELPVLLPHMNTITLPRLSQAEIAMLSRAMLGEKGQNQAVLSLLQRESEGNAFFLVELVRVLAEQAGQTSKISQIELPEKLFPEGVQSIVNQRLARVPKTVQPILLLAAVAGRQLDFNVLSRAINQGRIEDDWLMRCALAAVLEIQDGVWQFTHDKIREGLLDSINDQHLPRLHQQIAEAIEVVYPNQAEKAAVLKFHWESAGNRAKIAHYAFEAGRYASAQYVNDEAADYFSEALSQIPPSDFLQQYRCLAEREQVYDRLGQRDQQAKDLEQLAVLAKQLNEGKKQAAIALRQAKYAHVIGDFGMTRSKSQEAVEISLTVNNYEQVARGHLLWGTAARLQGHYQAAEQQLREAIQAARIIDAQGALCESLGQLSMTLTAQSKEKEALLYGRQSLEISRNIQDKVKEGYAWYHLGWISQNASRYRESEAAFHNALKIYREIGHRRGESMVLAGLGHLQIYSGQYSLAMANLTKARQLNEAVSDQGREGVISLSLANLSSQLGQHDLALTLAKQAITIFKKIEIRLFDGQYNHVIGNTLFAQGHFQQAAEHFQKALATMYELGYIYLESFFLNSLGQVFYALENYKEARDCFLKCSQLAKARPADPNVLGAKIGLTAVYAAQDDVASATQLIDEVFDQLIAHSLIGICNPFRTCLLCYDVLEKLGDSRNKAILSHGHDILQKWASQIDDKDSRESFLTQKPTHLRIITLYQDSQS